MIANNRSRKAKSLWSDLGEGDPVHVRELEDEHAEARFVVSEIERLVDEGGSRDDIAVFYRTNAQSRVLEDMLVRYGVSLPGDRRHALLRARRDQGRARLPHAAREPVRHGGLRADRQLAPARDRRRPRRAASSATRTRSASRSGTWPPRPTTCPGWRPAAVKAVGRFMSVMERLRERAEGGAGVGDLLAGDARGDRLHRGAPGRADDRGAGGSRTWRSSWAWAREYDAGADEGLGRGVPAADRALLRAGHAPRRAGTASRS